MLGYFYSHFRLYKFLKKKQIWKHWVKIWFKRRTANYLKENLKEIFDKRLSGQWLKGGDKRQSSSEIDTRNCGMRSNHTTLRYSSSPYQQTMPSSCKNIDRDAIFSQWKQDFHK